MFVHGHDHLVHRQARLHAEPEEYALQLRREVYRELVEINTVDSVGSTTQAAEAMEEK